ncbi:MAG: TetR/AcrR family transcriptional regulator [Vulcanimicrobiaceae bacterium]
MSTVQTTPAPHELRAGSPDHTRERIVVAAREVMGRKGKRGATTREIAEMAGVNEATLFRHFGNKEGIVAAVAQRFCPAVELQALAARLSGNIDEDLFELGRVLMDRMEGLQDMIRWSMVEQHDPLEEPLISLGDQAWRAPEAIQHVLTEYMSRRIASGDLKGDAKRLSRVFMGLVFSHVMSQQKFPDPEVYANPEASLRFYIDVFLNGVRS